MLFELRTYDLKPGKAPAYLEFFRTFGVRLVTRHLPMGGYWMVESGRLNRIEHLWITQLLPQILIHLKLRTRGRDVYYRALDQRAIHQI